MSSEKKLAIIGASLFQQALILKAREMGVETHVFAWKTGDAGEEMADYFYPISTREQDQILEKCREIGIDGITSIGSDIAMLTVNYVADKMGLVGNSIEATRISTNKHWMREAFEKNGDPSPKSVLVDDTTDLSQLNFDFPIIVKPTDRSGSRGITKIWKREELEPAVREAIEISWEGKALVEEFAEGQEYSVEYISYAGKHWMLTVTQKKTSGEPYYMETGHIQPAPITNKRRENIRRVCDHALDTLGLKYGAAHAELKVDDDESIKIIEIGGRMGGDFIGSDLVQLSTGYDFVRAVIEVALGEELETPEVCDKQTVAVRFIASEEDYEEYQKMKNENPERIVKEHITGECKGTINLVDDRTDSYIYIVK